MRFPAFENTALRQPKWLAADPLAFSTWVKLCCRCAEDENGGRLGGAVSWNEHVWLTMANVTEAGVAAAVAAGLCRWDGDSLLVSAYDLTSEKVLNAKRKAGRKFGQLGGRPKKSDNPPNNPKGFDSETLTRKGKEGKGKERIGKAERGVQRGETEAFGGFYARYPRKEKRPVALRAWISNGCEAIAAEVMAGLERWLPDFAARPPDRVPHPASWLNGEGWKDLPPARTPSSGVPIPIRSTESYAVKVERERQARQDQTNLGRAFEAIDGINAILGGSR